MHIRLSKMVRLLSRAATASSQDSRMVRLFGSLTDLLDVILDGQEDEAYKTVLATVEEEIGSYASMMENRRRVELGVGEIEERLDEIERLAIEKASRAYHAAGNDIKLAIDELRKEINRGLSDRVACFPTREEVRKMLEDRPAPPRVEPVKYVHSRILEDTPAEEPETTPEQELVPEQEPAPEPVPLAQRFVEEHTKVYPLAMEDLNAMREAYSKYCLKNGEEFQDRDLILAMEARGAKIRTIGDMYSVFGLILMADQDEPVDPEPEPEEPGDLEPTRETEFNDTVSGHDVLCLILSKTLMGEDADHIDRLGTHPSGIALYAFENHHLSIMLYNLSKIVRTVGLDAHEAVYKLKELGVVASCNTKRVTLDLEAVNKLLVPPDKEGEKIVALFPYEPFFSGWLEPDPNGKMLASEIKAEMKKWAQGKYHIQDTRNLGRYLTKMGLGEKRPNYAATYKLRVRRQEPAKGDKKISVPDGLPATGNGHDCKIKKAELTVDKSAVLDKILDLWIRADDGEDVLAALMESMDMTPEELFLCFNGGLSRKERLFIRSYGVKRGILPDEGYKKIKEALTACARVVVDGADPKDVPYMKRVPRFVLEHAKQ